VRLIRSHEQGLIAGACGPSELCRYSRPGPKAANGTEAVFRRGFSRLGSSTIHNPGRGSPHEGHDLRVVAEMGSEGCERPEALQRVPCGIRPGLVVKVRRRWLAAAHLFRSVGALRSEYHTLVPGFDHNRLMARRMAGRQE
jgi:hypothetical protein